MNVLLSGGAGFIGSHIAEAYLRLGHRVIIVDDLSSGKKSNFPSEAAFYQVNICDKAAVLDIFTKEKPDILNHHAAQMEVRRSVSDPQFDASVNIIGMLNLLEAGRVNGLKKIVFASSGGAIYGDAKELPTSENYPPQPASPYGITKLSSEYYLHFYEQTYGIKYMALRYGNVYGPRQNPHGEAGVVAIFAQKLLKNVQPVINGDGKQSRDFVFVGDVVAANVAALNSSQSQIVNIGTGISTTINEIFSILVKLTNTQFVAKYGDAKAGEQRISVLNNTKAGETLAWQPKTSLEEGLKETVDFFRTAS